APIDAGALAWAEAVARPIDAQSRTLAQGVATAADGSVTVTAIFAGTVRFGAGSANETTLSSSIVNQNVGEDGFVARYASDGTFQSVIQIRGGTIDMIYVGTFTDGSLVVTGTF